MGLQQRGLALGTPDLGTGLPDRDTVLEHGQLGGGHIDQQAVGFHVLGQPAKTLEVDAQLFPSYLRADVQFGQGARPDNAIGLQRMAELEIFYRAGQLSGVIRADQHRHVGQVALAEQPLSQSRYACILHAGAQ
ncbi:hypothetical protein D3C72_2012290 [compost metagenome]